MKQVLAFFFALSIVTTGVARWKPTWKGKQILLHFVWEYISWLHERNL
ncbi:MAG: hypothetical protein LBG96_05855 [Tannerella sp.]|nr:hypothetical protein [Tannerella sp.]